MVYGKRRYRKKTYRKRGARRRPPTTRVIRQIAAKTVRSMAEHKMKQVENSLRSVAADTDSSICLNNMTLGDDISNRTGRQIMMTSIQLNMVFYNTSASADKQIRVILLYDREPQETAPAVAEVWDTTTVDWQYGAPRLIDNRYRFKILKDWMFTLSSTDSDDNRTTKIIRYYRKLKHATIYDAGNAGSIADIRKGSLYLIYRALTDVNVDYVSRLRFIDF